MREGLTRTGPQPPLTPAATLARLWKWRDFVWTLSAREIRMRYVGSLGGAAWNIIQPLVLIAVFTVLFSALMQVSPFAGGQGYVIYLVAALLPWNALQEVLVRSSSVFIENSYIVSKLPFPLESLVAQSLAVATLNLVIGLLILTALLPLLGIKYSTALLLLPVAVALQLILTAGPALLVATISPFWRDVPPFTSLALFIGFWLTPIVYMPDVLPGFAQKFFAVNPAYHLAEFYRACFTGGGFPSILEIGSILAWGALFIIIGWLLFARLHRRVPEVL